MFKVGITGGIGSGKTIISQVFELVGIPVFYADEEARSLMHNDEILVEGIKDTFGENSYLDGALNRRHIADIVFKDAGQLAALNALVHPAVFRAFDVWADRQKSPYVLKEAALLFESNSYKLCDKTILVVAPEPVRIARVMGRSGLSENEVRDRIDKQLHDHDMIPLADFVLHNDEKKLLIPQILQLHEKLLALSAL